MKYDDQQTGSDYFDPGYHHKDYRLSDNNTTVSKVEDSEGNVFLSTIARNGVHRWKFKLSIPTRQILKTTLTIGIWKDNKPRDTNDLLFDSIIKEKYMDYVQVAVV